MEILLDMDGVLSDFLSSALRIHNEKYRKEKSVEDYVREYGRSGINEYYGISIEEFWKTIEGDPIFWKNLDPFPWAVELYERLLAWGNVTIVTSPSNDFECAKQKQIWAYSLFGIKPSEMFVGSRKRLLAGNGILIDDYEKNVVSFRKNGGNAILVPSNWNTPSLTFDKVWTVIEEELCKTK